MATTFVRRKNATIHLIVFSIRFWNYERHADYQYNIEPGCKGRIGNDAANLRIFSSRIEIKTILSMNIATGSIDPW